MKAQVKIFQTTTDSKELEDKINYFLAVNPDSTLIDIKYQHNEDADNFAGYSALLIYRK